MYLQTIGLDKIIGIMCYSNDIYNYSTKSINDDNWHKVLIIFSINKIFIDRVNNFG